ncbi:NmrA family NAD(P)-binding protein [Nocardia sp. NBC_00565]|uniref:NmrA family NAD(P)-binding protein n=1 Tax=Nocardia sp. NBC_00565 TaxID=2975993 RepID=UPI002E817FC4|nr:NmrA family NAD(P)-binding protein [Nocardia sp. NBC_00565]WUC00259.1 NmrA family NAD(P)-binding protein [Nocardia sp. NBC_00565]
MTGSKGRVLVIGATGQQGRATTAQLLEHGWEVHAFVRARTKGWRERCRGIPLRFIGDFHDERCRHERVITDGDQPGQDVTTSLRQLGDDSFIPQQVRTAHVA